MILKALGRRPLKNLQPIDADNEAIDFLAEHMQPILDEAVPLWRRLGGASVLRSLLPAENRVDPSRLNDLLVELDSRMPLGTVLSAVLAAGAFAAFLSTASGLTISVAGVDLIYLGLNVILSSVETLIEAERRRTA